MASIGHETITRFISSGGVYIAICHCTTWGNDMNTQETDYEEGVEACKQGAPTTGFESVEFDRGYGDQYSADAAQDKGFN